MPRKAGKGKKLAGLVSITRYSDETFRIEVRDRDARIVFLEIEMDPGDITRALSGRGDLPATLTIRGLDLIGTRAENKMEIIPVPVEYLYNWKGQEPEILAPYEVDGWKALPEDLRNAHNYLSEKEAKKLGIPEGKRGIRVAFFRNVPVEE